jgi:hypothetical protein
MLQHDKSWFVGCVLRPCIGQHEVGAAMTGMADEDPRAAAGPCHRDRII